MAGEDAGKKTCCRAPIVDAMTSQLNAVAKLNP
jgi:hypothetical protein